MTTNKKYKDIISVSEIREINSFLHQTAESNYYKIVIIDSTDNLNINSSNALLKNLEEPKKYPFFSNLSFL